MPPPDRFCDTPTSDSREERADIVALRTWFHATLGLAMVQDSLRHVAGPDVVLTSLSWFPLLVPVHVLRRVSDERAVIDLIHTAASAMQR